MTISYSAEVATATLGTFGRLLLRWKASVYKLVWRETLIFVFLYILVAVTYRVALPCEHQRRFEGWAKFCAKTSTILPLTFVMGFFVNLVITRWWAIFRCVAWPDRACYYVSMCLPSSSPEVIQYRRAIVRYINLAQLLVLRDVSTSVKTRFPTLDKIVADGFMTPEERTIFDSIKGENQLDKHHKYWIAMQWASNVLCRAYDRCLIRDHQTFERTFEQIVSFRDRLALMLVYDWVSVPLSYTQVVTMVVYAYFATALVGRQYLFDIKCCPGTVTSNITCDEVTRKSDLMPGPNEFIQKYVPIFPLLEFVFYMGWLKVAESIMNPLGNDDDDFEINYIINRNLAVSYGIVDSYSESCPQVKKELEPSPAVCRVKAKSHRGSATEYLPSRNPDGTTKRPKHHRKRHTDAADAQERGAAQQAIISPGHSLTASSSRAISPVSIASKHPVEANILSAKSTSRSRKQMPKKS